MLELLWASTMKRWAEGLATRWTLLPPGLLPLPSFSALLRVLRLTSRASRRVQDKVGTKVQDKVRRVAYVLGSCCQLRLPGKRKLTEAYGGSVCHYCREPGHIKRDCPKRGSKKQWNQE